MAKKILIINNEIRRGCMGVKKSIALFKLPFHNGIDNWVLIVYLFAHFLHTTSPQIVGHYWPYNVRYAECCGAPDSPVSVACLLPCPPGQTRMHASAYGGVGQP